MASRSPIDGAKRRGFLSRIGICALNLVLPGLGLMRLARYGLAGIFFILFFVAIGLLLGGYFLIEQMQFSEWAILISAFIALGVTAYLGSIAATWRLGKTIEPRSGVGWRWYGVLAIWLVWSFLSSPISSLSRSRYRTFYIVSVSMLPTFQINDRIIADMHDIGPLVRGDVVIVHANGEDYVKRVAGLPRDRILLVDGTLFLNGKPIAQQFVENARFKVDDADLEATVSREQFPGEAKPHLVMDTGPSAIDNVTETALPPDRYFLLGDNRDHSADSRVPPGFESGLGLVPRSEITGRIAFRYWRKGVGIGPGRD